MSARPSVFVVRTDGRPTATHNPNSSLRYGLDVSGVLADGDSLATATAAASAGVTVGPVTFSGTVITARISGGTSGETGSVTLRWTTEGGDTDERTLYFDVQ